jgi:hypothetical protein
MGFLMKGILLYLLLATAIAFAAPQMIFNAGSPSDSTVLSWFNVRVDSNNTVYYDTANYSAGGSAGTGMSNLTSVPQLPSGTGFLGFIDPLLHVFSWIGTFGKVLFSPIIIMTKPEMTGAPIALLFIIGIPVVVLFLVGLIVWIRSGES